MRYIGHFPFRNWCAACVAGRAQDTPHLMTNGTKGGIPKVTIDFF